MKFVLDTILTFFGLQVHFLVVFKRTLYHFSVKNIEVDRNVTCVVHEHGSDFLKKDTFFLSIFEFIITE